MAPDQGGCRRPPRGPRAPGLPSDQLQMTHQLRGGEFSLPVITALVFATVAFAQPPAATQPPPTTPPAQTAQPQEPPRFRSSVDVTSLDVTVVDDRGKPITDLKPADFVVRIDGNQRKVATAEWVPLTTPPSDKPAVTLPEGYSSNETSTGGRLIVIAVDEPNIRFGGALAISKAASLFIDRLSPSDRIAVAGFGVGAPATVFTADRERVKRVLSRMVGQKHPGRTMDLGHNIA